jgi:serine/threonine protein kinase
VLGSGATGIVFRAKDTELLRVVALKVLRLAIAANPENRCRFLLEARASAAIDHDNILPIYQIGENRGIPWLAMKLLRGCSLKDCLSAANGRLSPDETLRIGAEVADALVAAHSCGLVHRDVKPSNILLEKSTGRVKLIDFGLALGCDDEGQPTPTGFGVVGTPAYMPSEQINGALVDYRCDLYALGCVMYQCCTGRLPYAGQTIKQVRLAQRTQKVIPPGDINPFLPAEVTDFIMDLVAKETADRPKSAVVVRDRLRNLRANLAVPSARSLADGAFGQN